VFFATSCREKSAAQAAARVRWPATVRIRRGMWALLDHGAAERAAAPARRKHMRRPAPWVLPPPQEQRCTIAPLEQSLVETKLAVAEAQRDCQRKLGAIVREQFAAEDLEASVVHELDALRSEASALEAERADATSAAEEARDAATPALAAAADALSELNRPDFAELKAYSSPPMVVELVLCAVLVLRQREPSWEEAKRMLSDANFLGSLIHFDRSSLTAEILERLHRFTFRPEFQPEAIRGSSRAAYSLSTWCIAMQVYGKVTLELFGQDSAVEQAELALSANAKAQHEAERQLEAVRSTLAALQSQYREYDALKEALADETSQLDARRPAPVLAVSLATASRGPDWLEDWCQRGVRGHSAAAS
jgi:dynein heavy chain